MIVIYFLILITILSVTFIISLRVYQLNRKRQDIFLEKRILAWKDYLNSLLSSSSIGQLELNRTYFEKLNSSVELMAFTKASTQLSVPPIQFHYFLVENKQNWIHLATQYKKKSQVSKAYFAYVCEKFRLNRSGEYTFLTETMIDFALDPSIYCRENALKALYAFGNTDSIIDVFSLLTEKQITHNKKLLTDGLLSFEGDQKKLATDLYTHIDQFSNTIQIAIIDYFRFSAEHLQTQVIDLVKENSDKDFICSVLRYYQKYPVPKYKNILLSYLNSADDTYWECASIAASALVNYPGDDTFKALKQALFSKHWYVRLNAARSIAGLGFDESQVSDILNGQDEYAKEQLNYQIFVKKDGN